MPNFYTPPFDASALQSQIDAINAASAFVTQSVMTWANVLTTYPAGAAYLNKYVRISDMWGSMSGILRCTYNGRIYWWGPTDSEQYGKDLTNPGTLTFNPITIPPIMNLTGIGPGLTITNTITFDLTQGAYPGMIMEVVNGFSSLLGALNIAGTGLGSTVSSLLGSTKRFVVIDTGSALALRQRS